MKTLCTLLCALALVLSACSAAPTQAPLENVPAPAEPLSVATAALDPTVPAPTATTTTLPTPSSVPPTAAPSPAIQQAWAALEQFGLDQSGYTATEQDGQVFVVENATGTEIYRDGKYAFKFLSAHIENHLWGTYPPMKGGRPSREASQYVSSLLPKFLEAYRTANASEAFTELSASQKVLAVPFLIAADEAQQRYAWGTLIGLQSMNEQTQMFAFESRYMAYETAQGTLQWYELLPQTTSGKLTLPTQQP